MTTRVPSLSKSRYQKGLQCHRQLWWECHRKDLADPIPEVRQAIFDRGHTVGELARLRFPEGRLIEAGHRQGALALRQTAERIAGGAPTLFEAAFAGDEVFVRADIVQAAPGGLWDLIEVKQSAGAKDEHVTDLAVQMHSLESAGLPIRSASVLHIDKQYLWPGGDYDPQALFALEDVTDRARAHQAEVPTRLAEMRRMLRGPCPEVRYGTHCRKPYDCAFLGHCHSALPDFPVTELPWVTDEQLAALQAEGILAVEDVPPACRHLQPRQRSVCRAAVERRVEYGPGLATSLAGLEAPVYFLDFETVMPALPLYPGTRPYQTIPVQWSLHRFDGNGGLAHLDYLHQEPKDPRPALVESLLQAVGDGGSIVVYSSFEKTRLSELADELPAHGGPLRRVQTRLFDLEKVIKAHVQHHAFRGRSSLKRVLPALVPALGYEGLAVQDGQAAMIRYEDCLRRGVDGPSREALWADLREYCALDTLGLFRVYRHLCEAAGLD
jgi:hypothetical protein